jgi:hypothetical protein
MSEALVLPQLTLEEKWATAEDNLIYFVVSGITYAKSKGDTPEDFGAWAGAVAVPFWAGDRGRGPRALVAGIAYNKQQFKDFAIEILRESPTVVEARMRGFGADVMADYAELDVTADDYVRFFEAKWRVIADSLDLDYVQVAEGTWTRFTVSVKQADA